MKVKLTPLIGESGNTITFNDVEKITKISKDTIYITFKECGQKFCLEKCNLILYLDEGEVNESE
jgi:hypothetical protein